MKIGIVLSNPPGYSETFFNTKIKGLQDKGMEVVLFVQKDVEKFNLCKTIISPIVYNNPIRQFLASIIVFGSLIPTLKQVIKFIKLERKENSSVFNIYKKVYLNAHILKQKVDWLHFGFATQALESELVAKSIGAKMAVSFRGFDINVYPVKNPNCYKRVWENVDKIHSISNYLLQKAYSLGLSEEVSFQLITPAVDLQKIIGLQSNVVTERNRSEDENKKPVKIVTIARLNWIKGIDVAICAMKILKEKGIDFTYKIIGSGSTKELERYQYQVYQLCLSKEVSFLGKLSHSETIQQLNEATIYLQPSLNEGFCNAVLEALALGKLCIASNIGGLPENIQDHKTGWLVSKSNSEALANKIKEVVHLPNDKKREIANNAQERIKKQFTIKQQQKQFVEFYK